MKVVFVSNYFNHHQKPLSDALFRLTNTNYCFIQTSEMEQERIKMGWGLKDYPEYVINSYIDEKSLKNCQKLIDEADVVIIGSAPEFLIKERLKQKKLIFRYSERIFKKKCKWFTLPLRLIKYFFKYNRYKNLYMLCASAYTAADYSKTFSFLDKTYKWGYFTEVKKYEDINNIIAQKKKASILWVARLIEWKHPDTSIEITKRLKQEGYDIQLNLIGSGVLEETLRMKIKEENLEDCVHLLGSMSPEEVRANMEKSEIFLFTSDRNEGWGAVLNEAMNSACAVVASHSIGSVPFLIQDKENGLIYRDGDLSDLYNKVKFLLDNPKTRIKMARNAYYTMIKEWNAENAATRFLILTQAILNGEEKPNIFENGVCSKANILKDDWY